jgi:ABC-type sugar transport system ATPase subunit
MAAKTFGGVRALDRASLTVRHGEIHGLLGQNGFKLYRPNDDGPPLP